jgi:hypothetical protein
VNNIFNKKRIVIVSMLLLLGIGVKLYMDNKDQQELLRQQTNIANYIYNNYRVYTVDEEKDSKLDEEYNYGKGSMSTEEFIKKSVELREYSDIEKIEFTSISISDMGSLLFFVKLNERDDLRGHSSLDTISAETNDWIYGFSYTEGENAKYFIQDKEEPTNLTFDKKNIIYHERGID